MDFFWRRVSGNPVTTVPLSFFVLDLAQAVPNTYLVYWGTGKKGKKKTLRITVFCEPWKDIMKLQHNDVF